MMKIYSTGIHEALERLSGGEGFAISNNSYDSLVWFSKTIPKPTKDQVDAEMVIVLSDFAATEYQRLRVLEYPPITDYIDGVVKGDQAQIDAYIAACQAVKDKYPKPESV